MARPSPPQNATWQVECTIDGIVTPEDPPDFYGLTNTIKTERPYPMSRIVSTVTGLKAQRNKEIVG
jgi:2-isopropylmalate synthase